MTNFSLPKQKNTIDVFHHPSALHPPRHVFASVNLHISPPSFVCGLHPFFKTLVRLPLTIHGTAEDLDFLFNECLVRFPPWPDNVIQLRLSFFPIFTKLLVREGRFFLPATIGPREGDLAMELLRNAIPHQLLETTVISFTPRGQHKGPYISLNSPMTSSSVHKLLIEVARKKKKSLAPARRPSRKI